MTLKERWQRIQKEVGAIPDGIPNGPNTIGKIEAALGIGAVGLKKAPDPPKIAAITKRKAPEEVDPRSAKNIETLQPEVRSMFKAITLAGKAIAIGLGAGDYKLISGNRTYAEQNALYEKGRSKPGRKVTNARGGYSNHNFGIAGDFGAFGKDGDYLDNSDPVLAEAIHRATADWAKKNFAGEIEWGGDWKRFVDIPHFQFKSGLTLAQMRDKVSKGKSIV